ncbi:DUF1566 domain-containing protein [Desulfobulbus sp. TB]|nr:DUF1566 domain-containing protein [Desulfobulbus sp. TB]
MAETTEKRYAILIGSSKYPDEPGLTELRCPENDVDAVNKILTSHDYGQFTKTLVFKNRFSHEIEQNINRVLFNASKDDLILIYFSGHGKLSRSGTLSLVTADTKLSALESTSILSEKLKYYFDHSYSRKKILLLDCCYSGAIGKVFKGGIDDQLQLISEGQGTFIMSASTGIGLAEEKEEDQYGLFTKHLVQGIRSGEADKNEDGFVDMQELYEYVHDKVQEEGAQKPMQWGLDVKGSIIIARSGRDAKKKRRQNLRAKLYNLASQGLLSDSVVSKAVNIISLSDKEMTTEERESFFLVEQLADESVSTGDFVERWLKICLSSEDEQEVGEDRLVTLKNRFGLFLRDIFSNLFLRFIFAGLVTVIFLIILNHQPPETPPNPAINTVSVSWPIVPPLPEIKLQPLPEAEAEKRPQKNKIIGQYIDHGDRTVTDTRSGLMWKRCSEGLSGDKCEMGKVERYKYDDAVERFKNIAYAAGYADWRLPTVDELKTLLYCSKGKNKEGSCKAGSEKPTINQQAFPNAEAEYVVWSGSPLASYSDYAWGVHFYIGGSRYVNRINYNAVRLVRSGK